MKSNAIPKNGYGFKRAYDDLPKSKQKEFRDALMKGFNIKRSMFYKRMNGLTVPSEADQEFIRNVFKEYGCVKCFDYEYEERQGDH